MGNAKYSLDLHRSPAVIYVYSGGLKYEVCLKDGATSVEMAGSLYPVAGCPFPVELASARFWLFVNKNTNWIAGVGIIATGLILLQLGLMTILRGDFMAMSISYFSLFMNSTLCFLFCMCVIVYCCQKFLGNYSFCMFQDEKEEVKLLDIGQVSIGSDIPVFSLMEDEAPASFEARMRKAIESAGDEKWVVVMPFGHHMTSVYMGLRPDGETVDAITFLRHIPFVEGPFTEQQVSESMKYSKSQTFGQYLDYCRGFASEYLTWSAVEKMPKYSPFETIVSTMKSGALCFAVLVMCFVSAHAQKTAQIKAYLGDRAEMATPSGKMIDFVFEQREISVLSQGKSYVETIKDAAFFTDEDNAGRLVLIKSGGVKILPKSPAKQKTTEAIIPTDAPVVGGGASQNFYESLPDSLEADALINKDKIDRMQNWVHVKPSVNLWMYRFHRLLGVLFIFGIFLWIVCAIGASEAVNDLGSVKVISDFLISVYVVSKSALIFIWIFVLSAYALEAMITHWFIGELSAYFFLKFAGVAAFAVVLFKWVFPDLQRRRAGSGSVVSNSPYPHRQLGNG